MAKFVPIQTQNKQNQEKTNTGPAPKFVPFDENQQLASLFNQSEFGPSDIGFSERMRVASGDNFAERRNIFLRIHPEGSFERVPAAGFEVFRRDPSESFRRFNPEGADITDLAEIGGQAGAPILGEIAFNLPLLLAPQVGLPTVIGRTVLGATTGEAVEQGIQSLTGVQEDDPITAFSQRPATEGLFSLGGSVLGAAVLKSIDGLRGAGVFSLRPGARESIEASQRLGVPSPLPGQTTRSRIIERLQGQSGQTTPIIQESIDRTNSALGQTLKDLATLSPAERMNAINSITEALDQSKSQFVNSLSSGRNLSRDEFGQFIQDSRSQYARESQASVSEAYNIARSFEEPSFDLSSLKSTAEELSAQTRVTTRGPSGAVTEEVIPDGLDEVRTIADQIRRADPESVGIQQLEAWERQLFDLTQPSVPGGPVREINKKARDLRSAVRSAFDSPTSKNPEFVSAWKRARAAARKRFETLEDSFSLEIGKTDRPSVIVDKLMSPNRITGRDIDLIRRVTSDEKFRNVQGGFVDRLLLEPDKLTKSLDSYDPDVLSKMVSPVQLDELRKVGFQIDNLNMLNISKAAKRQEQFSPFIRDLVSGDAQTARIAGLKEFVENNGGLEGSLGRIVRTGLIEELAKKTTENIPREGGQQIKARAFRRALEDFEERGLDQFFTRTELRNLRDIINISEFTDVGGEGIAGLIGAQTTQQAFQGKAQAIANLVRNFGLGNILVSEGGKRFIQGVGKAPTRREMIVPTVNAVGRVMIEDAKLGADEGLPSLQDLEEFLSSSNEAEQ